MPEEGGLPILTGHNFFKTETGPRARYDAVCQSRLCRIIRPLDSYMLIVIVSCPQLATLFLKEDFICPATTRSPASGS